MTMCKALITAVLLSAFTLGSALAAAPKDPQVHVLARDAKGGATFLTGQLGHLDAAAPVASARAAFRAHAALFAARGDEDLQGVGVQIDALGRTHVKLQQRLQGRPIVGAELIVHGDAAGEIYAINGHLASFSQRPRRGHLDPAEALVRAAAEAEILDWEPQGDPQLLYLLDEEGTLHLAWAVDALYSNAAGPHLDRVFADTVSGHLVGLHPQYKRARNRRTHTANNGTSLPGTLILTETGGSTSDNVIQTAHDYAGATYDYFAGVHGRDSFDGNGATLTSTVHYSSNYNNAFWNGSQMVYGDGDGTTFRPLALALDVDAHELSHAVTEYTANLVYQREPGALNEGISDIFGAAVEAWYTGSVNGDTWKLGEDIYTPATAGDALRYMNNPTQDGYSADYYPERLYASCAIPTQNNDYCGVHGNSGIANLAFVLLVQGGTHPRGKTSISVPALGMSKAERIFYRALSVYMTSGTTFEGARNATAQAATDLYGASSADVAAVHKAWDAVGVPGGSGSGGGVLDNGVPVSNLSGSQGSEQRWTMAVPAGATNLSFQISGGSGDADLYVKYGSAPSTSSYDCRPYRSGNNETCSFASPSAGTWHVMLRAYTSYSGVTLVGSYTVAAPNNPPTANFTFSVSNLTASFTDTSTDSDGTITSRSWTFGDGGSSTATNPTRTYAAAGTYNVTLTVTDDDGASDSITKSVTVTAPPPSGCSGTLYTGTLSSGGYQYQPNGTYYYSGSGVHNGILDGPAGTDFDLYLYKWSGSRWSQLRSSISSTSPEETTYRGTSGYYLWKVTSYSGSGSYTFCLTTP